MSTENTPVIDKYNPHELEIRWQEKWEQDGLYSAKIDPDREKFYFLTMLPYPSGDLHLGHWYAMAPTDARARYLRMNGYNVMFPVGFDSFGLPAENAAMKQDVHPREWTYRNIDRMRGQLRRMGATWDWDREIVTSDPEYYRWSQWLFLQLLKNDLAYRQKASVDFCPNCNTTLAREQVWGDDRHCERCQTPVVKRDLTQWFLRITNYADELLDYSAIDWPERVKTLQKNWIGRSEGASVTFQLDSGKTIEVFTTRPDTLWGVTFLALAPEHPLVGELTLDENRGKIEAYREEALRFSEIQRQATDKEKSGVFTGSYAVNAVNGERIPVWVADYVMMTYGSGAVMGVPAHDQRDFEFAEKHGLEIRPVIEASAALPLTAATTEPGAMINSGPLTGTPPQDAIAKTIDYLEQRELGARTVSYRLHDWLISRQRYWGTPIPIIHCAACGPVPDENLPIKPPEDIEWRPTGESPLKYHPTWKNTNCPNCGAAAERETDTMDTFICSSWYHYRYLSPQYEDGPWDPEQFAYWMPVDAYTGGIEHATMHLIYIRFFTKALRDAGVLNIDEPVKQLRTQGMILGEDFEKMSKSRGNVVAPDGLVESYGADTLRAFLMFFARWSQGGPWSSQGIEGVARWLNRLWTLVLAPPPAAEPKFGAGDQDKLRQTAHQIIQRVTYDLENFEFNTVISALMELTNALQSAKANGAAGTDAYAEGVETLLKLCAPVAPHVTEELWHRQGHSESIHVQPWPQADADVAAEKEVTLVVQVNGKVRDKITVPAGLDKEAALQAAMSSDSVSHQIGDQSPKKIIHVPDKLINLVV